MKLTMEETSPIKKASWKGRIPIMFTLSPEEVAVEKPTTYIVHASRFSYLPVLFAPATKEFKDSAVLVGENRIWFEFQGIPLKWQYPIGTLFDLYCEQSSNLPFQIIVHFRDVPKEIIPLANEKEAASEAEVSFFSSLKQALYLQYASTETVRDLPVAKQTSLWNSVSTGSFENFFDVWTDVNESQRKLYTKRAFLPIRVLVKQQETSLVRCLQMPVRMENKSGTPCALTLGEVLDRFVEKFGIPKGPLNDEFSPFIAGIRPPLEADVEELWTELANPDSFLYVCLRS